MNLPSTTSAKRITVLILLLLSSGCDSTTPEEYLHRAQSQIDGNALNAAVVELKNALKKQPEFADARLLLGEVYLRQGDYPSALKELDRAENLGRTDDRVLIASMSAKLGLGRRQEVIGALASRQDISSELTVLLADAYLQGGDTEQAKSLYASNEHNARTQVGLAIIAWQEGDINQAREHFQAAIDGDPANFQNLLKKAEFELSVGEVALADEAFTVVQALPGGKIPGQVGSVRVNLARGEFDQAKTTIALVLKQAPRYPLGHYLNSLVAFQQDDLETAMSSLREVQRAYPDHAPSLYLMGLVNYRKQQYSQAQSNLRRFLVLNPDNESARKLLATVEFESKSYAAALETLDPLINRSQDPQVFAMLGSVHLQIGNSAEAVEFLERAVELAPDMAPFRNQLALSLLSIGDGSRARAQLDSAIKVDEKQFQSDYLLAMINMRDGDLDAAQKSITSMLEKSPESPIGYNLLGALSLAREDKASARSAFEQAIANQPTFMPAVTNLARLDQAEHGLEAAGQRYETLLQQSPRHEGGLLALADVRARQSQPEAAIELLKKVVLDNPDNLPARIGVIRLYMDRQDWKSANSELSSAISRLGEALKLRILQADLALRQGKSDDAREAINYLQNSLLNSKATPGLIFKVGQFQERIQNYPLARANFEAVIKMARTHQPDALLELGRMDLRERNLAAANKRLQQLEAFGSKVLLSPSTRLFQGDLLAAEGKLDQAEAIYSELQNAGNRDALLRLANFRTQQPGAGIPLFQDWLTKHPQDLGVELLLASALLETGEQDAALAHYESLADRNIPVVLNNLAWLYMEKGDKRAVDTAKRAVALAPENGDIADTLGWILVQRGNNKEGARVLEQSLQLASNNPTVHYHLGVAYRNLENTDGAKRAFEAALVLGDFPERAAAQSEMTALD